jgi:hypothetical protein
MVSPTKNVINLRPVSKSTQIANQILGIEDADEARATAPASWKFEVVRGSDGLIKNILMTQIE